VDMLSLHHDLSKLNTMSIDEAMLSSRYKAQYRTRDGTVLPPTMTSLRLQQAAVSVVDMSRAMDMGCGLGMMPRHQHCHDDPMMSTRRPAKRIRRRRRHDTGDDVELMDTVDHTPRYLQYVTRDVSTPSTETQRSTRPVPVQTSERAARRSRLIADSEYISQPIWTSSRYMMTHHTDRHRRRAAAKSRHHVNTCRHQSESHSHSHSPADDLPVQTTSSLV